MKKILIVGLIFPFLFLSCNKAQNQEDTENKAETDDKKNVEADIQATTEIKKGEVVPDFSFATTQGNTYSMQELRGNVVLLNFFATWCPSCREEMPALQERVWEKYKENDFFLVSIGRDHSMKEVKKFREEKEYDFHFAPDTGKVIYNKFATKYIPRNVLINKKGKIVYQCTGFKQKEFQKLLDLLDEHI